MTHAFTRELIEIHRKLDEMSKKLDELQKNDDGVPLIHYVDVKNVSPEEVFGYMQKYKEEFTKAWDSKRKIVFIPSRSVLHLDLANVKHEDVEKVVKEWNDAWAIAMAEK